VELHRSSVGNFGQADGSISRKLDLSLVAATETEPMKKTDGNVSNKEASIDALRFALLSKKVHPSLRSFVRFASPHSTHLPPTTVTFPF